MKLGLKLGGLLVLGLVVVSAAWYLVGPHSDQELLGLVAERLENPSHGTLGSLADRSVGAESIEGLESAPLEVRQGVATAIGKARLVEAGDGFRHYRAPGTQGEFDFWIVDFLGRKFFRVKQP